MKVPVRVCIWAAQYNQMTWYAVTSGAVILVGALWFQFLYRPLNSILAEYAAATASLKSECAQTTSCIQSLRPLEEKIDRLRSDVLRKQGIKESRINWISSVITIAHQAGLAVTSCQVDAECAKNLYRCARARFGFLGTFDQLVSAITLLSSIDTLVGCKQWSLTQPDKTRYAWSCLLYHVSFHDSDCSCISERKTPST